MLRYLLISLLLLLTVLLYFPGTSGSLYYDDFRPMSNLAAIQDWLSAGIYITSETSGPLGRPLSMITFALQYQSWPNHTQHFLLFNIVLHALNGLLVYLLACAIIRKLAPTKSTSGNQWTAWFITALWLLSPLQISTSLIAIQRMAGLSAFFVFAGLLLYVYGLENYRTRLPKARLQQWLGLVLCSLLAVFSKENGILLPLFALVLEKTVFRQTDDPDRRLRRLFLWTSTMVVFGYLLLVVIKSAGVYPFRDFNMVERLLTQPYLLAIYLKLAFFPDLFAYNPFHEHLKAFTPATLPWGGWLALLALPALLLTAVWQRNRMPLFSFAVLWFFTAHLLESTVIGLELYFEHRNYVALFGPCLALGVWLSHLAERYRTLVVAGCGAYLLLIAVITGYVSSVWGSPVKAAELWFEKADGSARAAEHLALLYLEQNRLMEAYFVLQAQVKACPDCLGSRIQYALVACAANDPTSVAENLAEVKTKAPTQLMIGSAPSALASLKRQIEQRNCNLVNMAQLQELNQVLLQYQTKEVNASKRFELLLNLHQLAELDGRKEQSFQYLQQAYQLRAEPMLGEVIFNNLLDLTKFAEAQLLLEQQLCQPLPYNPFLRLKQQQQCQDMSQRLNASREAKP